MRKITKTHPPAVLVNWIQENREISIFNYESMPGDVKAQLKKKLLSEQGFLCAYTGLQINEDSSHIEHIKPQCECQRGEDVNYRNLVAAFPFNGGDNSHGYGAPIKGDWWDEDLFINPVRNENCDHYFIFNWSGKIAPFPPESKAPKTTITVLCLSHSGLTRLRKSAIKGFFGFTRSQPMTKAEAKILLTEIDTPDERGHLRPFCFALKQLLEKHILSN